MTYQETKKKYNDLVEEDKIINKELSDSVAEIKRQIALLRKTYDEVVRRLEEQRIASFAPKAARLVELDKEINDTWEELKRLRKECKHDFVFHSDDAERNNSTLTCSICDMEWIEMPLEFGGSSEYSQKGRKMSKRCGNSENLHACGACADCYRVGMRAALDARGAAILAERQQFCSRSFELEAQLAEERATIASLRAQLAEVREVLERWKEQVEPIYTDSVRGETLWPGDIVSLLKPLFAAALSSPPSEHQRLQAD